LIKKGGSSAFFLFKIWRCSSTYPAMRANVAERKLRALRANPVFGADEKRIRTKNTVMDKNRNILE